MKKYIYIIAIILVVSSCTNILDTKDLQNKNDQNFPVTIADLQSSLASVYQKMAAEQWGEMFVGTLASDEAFGGGGPNDYQSMAIDQQKKNNENMLSSTWSNYYTGIFRANKLIENIVNVKNVPDATKNQVMGEAYFMRAWFYQSLARLFGEVPLFIKAENVIKPKATPAELYAQIASDLKAAIELFPATSYTALSTNQLGHANKWAAEGLLARTFLFYTGYYQKTELPLVGGGSITKSQVVGYLEDCINNSGHDLAADFRTLWPYTNKFTVEDYAYTAGKSLKWLGEEGLNKETVFAIKFGNLGDWGNSAQNAVNTNYSLRGQSNQANSFPFGAGWGQGTVNSKMLDQWKLEEPGDPRTSMSVLNVNDPTEGIVKYEDNGWAQINDTHNFIKKYTTIMAWKNKAIKTFYPSYTNPLYGSSESTFIKESQDMVLLRFSDILLMHSELTGTSTGLNRVRARVGLAAISYSIDALQKERRHELVFEGIRYFDLLRWYRNDAGTVLKANQDGCAVLNSNVAATMSFTSIADRIKATGGFWPIPNTEISLSNGILKQAAGWDQADANL